MSTANKRHCYDIKQSPFYKLRNKRKLASLLGMSLPELQSIACRADNYRVFSIKRGTDKERLIEVPKPRLEHIHRRIFTLLARVIPPEHLHSGVKGRSYLTNAEKHIGAAPLIKLDIAKFFPSTKRWHVFDFFKNVMLCTNDVAGLLATVCTINGHLPTGTCLSQPLAFFAHYRMFGDVDHLARDRHVTFTTYVDDLSFSGNRANRRLLHDVKALLRARGLNSNKKKERIYKRSRPKLVTGVIVDDKSLRVPNRKQKQLHDGIAGLESPLLPSERDSEIGRLIGKAVAASQIDPAFRDTVFRLRRLQKSGHRITK